MINIKSAFDFEKIFDINKNNIALKIPFYYKSKPQMQDVPFGYLSLKSFGSMRFRYKELNPNRQSFFSQKAFYDKTVVPIELTHSKIVYNLDNQQQKLADFLLSEPKGDGYITKNKKLIPSVTVADCVPIYLFDNTSKVFGIVHSGWKGTGIISQAIKMAVTNFNANIKTISIIIGPHIQNCCYTVDKERKNYFVQNFTSKSITEKNNKFYLSLAQANIHCLKTVGILEENILLCNDCTCCNAELGSFRRESVNTSFQKIEFINPNEPPKTFTPMAAFVCF